MGQSIARTWPSAYAMLCELDRHPHFAREHWPSLARHRLESLSDPPCKSSHVWPGIGRVGRLPNISTDLDRLRPTSGAISTELGSNSVALGPTPAEDLGDFGRGWQGWSKLRRASAAPSWIRRILCDLAASHFWATRGGSAMLAPSLLLASAWVRLGGQLCRSSIEGVMTGGRQHGREARGGGAHKFQPEPVPQGSDIWTRGSGTRQIVPVAPMCSSKSEL